MKHFTLSALFVAVFAMSCQQGSDGSQHAHKGAATLDVGLAALFDTVNVVKMHLFVNDDSANYPYAGKAIEDKWLSMLDDAIQPREGKAFACYWIENDGSFILRLSDDATSAGELVLARHNPQSGKLEKIVDLASHRCDDNGCEQLDSWFIDLDDDRDLELVQLTQTFTPEEKLRNENFTVLARTQDGHFEPADQQLAILAVRDRYVPVRLVATR